MISIPSFSAVTCLPPRQQAARGLGGLLILLALLVTGCASSTASDKVPKGALAIVTQSGPIGFIAPSKGTVYILDVDEDRLLSTTPVEAGVKLLFNPQRLNSKHVHRLYFQKG
ncbi:MAG TPA: hypothetical protein VHP11_13115 [Tepidisphaeraceae bacterium]|nr:hypothetical protein [Tepidisphaeraceae bacterium]